MSIENFNKDEKIFKIEIGKRFAEIRTHFNMSQQSFANYFSINQSKVANIERGYIYPDMILLSRVMFELQINPYWIFSGMGEMISTPRVSQTQVTIDPDIIELMELLNIPKFRRSILAAADQLKEIFANQIEKYKDYKVEKVLERDKKEIA